MERWFRLDLGGASPGPLSPARWRHAGTKSTGRRSRWTGGHGERRPSTDDRRIKPASRHLFAAHAALPPPEPGDLVAVLDVGAYGFTESMPLFLSHPIPAEVAVRGGRAELIRPRLEPGEWLDRQIAPAW